MTKSSIIIGILIQIIVLMCFYFVIDSRIDNLEQADKNIVQGINQFIQSVTPPTPNETIKKSEEAAE